MSPRAGQGQEVASVVYRGGVCRLQGTGLLLLCSVVSGFGFRRAVCRVGGVVTAGVSVKYSEPAPWHPGP